MQGTHDIDQDAPADNGEAFDPHEAARVLADARREAQREFSLTPPLISVLMGAIILGAYVALWLSTHDQHPYKGPSLGVVGLVYGAVAVSIAVSATVYRRATAGVSGPSVSQQRVEGLAILLSYLGSPLIQGAMKHYGASDAIVYGVIPAAGPLIIVGTTVVGTAASNANWPQFGSALAVVIAGFVALFVGPSAAWLAAGVGLFVGVVGYAAVTARTQRAAGRA
jgi:hypothetical protein